MERVKPGPYLLAGSGSFLQCQTSTERVLIVTYNVVQKSREAKDDNGSDDCDAKRVSRQVWQVESSTHVTSMAPKDAYPLAILVSSLGMLTNMTHI